MLDPLKGIFAAGVSLKQSIAHVYAAVLEKTQQRPIATNVHTIGVFMLKLVQASGEILDTEGEAPESLQPDVLREVGVRPMAPNQVARREALMHRRVGARWVGHVDAGAVLLGGGG